VKSADSPFLWRAFAVGALLCSLHAMASDLHAQTPAISQWTWRQCSSPGTFQTYGWEFETNKPLLVTELGIWDHEQDGFVRPHDVAIWDDTFDVIASGRVPDGTLAELQGEFRYVEIDEVLLEPDRHYFVAAFMDAEWRCTNGELPVVADEIRFLAGRHGSFGSSISLPGTPTFGNYTLSASFRYSVVPEPAPLAMIASGIIALLPILKSNWSRRVAAQGIEQVKCQHR
jgi:hypothetical protein